MLTSSPGTIYFVCVPCLSQRHSRDAQTFTISVLSILNALHLALSVSAVSRMRQIDLFFAVIISHTLMSNDSSAWWATVQAMSLHSQPRELLPVTTNLTVHSL